MIWSLIAQILAVILDAVSVRLSTEPEKDLELLVLRQQIRILERRAGTKPRPSRVEKLLLALTAIQIRTRSGTGRQGFKDSLLLFTSQQRC